MKYHFKVHKENKGYWAECLELEGCLTQADSLEELYEMMKDALNLYISEPDDSTRMISLPDEAIRKSKTIAEVPVDSEVAFSFLVRYYRIKHKMTQHQAAKKLGLENINSYQRLERKKCNPSLRTIAKIKEIFPEFSLDFAIV